MMLKGRTGEMPHPNYDPRMFAPSVAGPSLTAHHDAQVLDIWHFFALPHAVRYMGAQCVLTGPNQVLETMHSRHVFVIARRKCTSRAVESVCFCSYSVCLCSDCCTYCSRREGERARRALLIVYPLNKVSWVVG